MSISSRPNDQHPTSHAPAAVPMAPGTYTVELPLDLLDEDVRLLDWVIGFVFDTLQARHLDLRIIAGTRAPARTTILDSNSMCYHRTLCADHRQVHSLLPGGV